MKMGEKSNEKTFFVRNSWRHFLGTRFQEENSQNF